MSERFRSIFIALPSGLLVKGAGAALNFLAVPIALHLLGEATYAAFAAILGFAGWLALGSAGIGNLTAMTIAGHTQDETNIRNQFWQAALSNFIGVIAATIVLAAPFYFFVEHLAQDVLPASAFLLRASAYYCFAAIALTAMSTAFEGRYVGLLQSNYCNLVRLTGQVIALFMLIALVPLVPNMLTLTIALTLGPLTTALWFMGRGSFESPPPPHFRFDLRTSFPLFLQGGAYLAVSLAVMFYSGGNLPFFASVFGKEQLATAGVMAKMVQLYFSLTSIFVIPLAAALKQAIAASDLAWAKKTLLASSIAITAGSALVAVLLFIFGARFIALWTGVELPALQQWIAPLAVMIAVTGWYHFWVYVCFAFEGAAPVAFCALCEIAIIGLAYYTLGSHIQPASSLWITAVAMLIFTGTILPARVISRLRGSKA